MQSLYQTRIRRSAVTDKSFPGRKLIPKAPLFQVALWSQKTGQLNQPVVWDYHVILVLKPIQDKESNPYQPTVYHNQESIVYDFDTSLSMPCKWEGASLFVYISQAFDEIVKIWTDYFASSFLEGLPPQYQRYLTLAYEFYVLRMADSYTQQIPSNTR